MRWPVLVVIVVGSGCAMRPPVVADVSCPKGTYLIGTRNKEEGQCQLPDGTRHGPSYAVTPRGVSIEGYDHGVPAGPWALYDAEGKLTDHGYRRGVTDSTEPSTDLREGFYDSPGTTGRLVVPARVRLFPVEGDVSFTAGTLLSTSGTQTSSFLGAAGAIHFPTHARIHYRGDAYRAAYVSYGVQGAVGSVTRAECDDPVIPGSGGFCGTRWLVGPVIRVGYARSTDGRADASVPSFLGYGKLAFLLGQDRWSSVYSSGTALVWRARVGAGYTALGALFNLAHSGSWLLIPLVALVEHAEAYVELGGDGGQALGVGGGIDVGFGL